MIKIILICLLAYLATACFQNVPQRPLITASDMSSDKSNSEKNKLARDLVRSIRSEYGSNAILSLGAISPSSYDFADVVRSFGRRAAISYTDKRPSLWVHYELEKVDGALKGPSIFNFVLTASLIRTTSVNLGTEVLMRSAKRGRCRTDHRRSKLWQCSSILPTLAEELLYLLERV